MKAATFHAPGDIRVEDVPDPRIEQPTDAIVRITHTAICGSDLWFYRGETPYEAGWPVGHEPMGVVEAVGAEVKAVAPGDVVLVPFAFSDGTCEFCERGLQTVCTHGGFWGMQNDGAQGEAIRAPLADGTLVPVPKEVHGDDAIMKALFPLTDVMGTGHHAAVCADLKPGGTAVVIGDGAVGLCGVLAAKRLGAEKIIAMGHHEGRLETARAFGATHVVSKRGEEAVGEVLDLTEGGAPHVLECVGATSAMQTAIQVARPGGAIGYVGVPHGPAKDGLDIMTMFFKQLRLQGGGAPCRAYMPELMADVVAGKLDPSPVFDMTVDLDGIPAGYAAMDQRKALKVFVKM